MSGNIDVRVGFDGDVKQASFEIEAGPGSVKIPNIDAQPIAFKKLALDGRLNRSPDQIQISRLAINLDEATAEMKGVVTRVETSPRSRRSFRYRSYRSKRFKNSGYPEPVVARVTGLLPICVTARLRMLPASLTARIAIEGTDKGDVNLGSLNGRFALDAVTIDYLAPMPPITDASATATFSNKRFDFLIQEGRVGDLAIEEGAVNIHQYGFAPGTSRRVRPYPGSGQTGTRIGRASPSRTPRAHWFDDRRRCRNPCNPSSDQFSAAERSESGRAAGCPPPPTSSVWR